MKILLIFDWISMKNLKANALGATWRTEERIKAVLRCFYRYRDEKTPEKCPIVSNEVFRQFFTFPAPQMDYPKTFIYSIHPGTAHKSPPNNRIDSLTNNKSIIYALIWLNLAQNKLKNESWMTVRKILNWKNIEIKGTEQWKGMKYYKRLFSTL